MRQSYGQSNVAIFAYGSLLSDPGKGSKAADFWRYLAR
jgi:hypothetical protein